MPAAYDTHSGQEGSRQPRRLALNLNTSLKILAGFICALLLFVLLSPLTKTTVDYASERGWFEDKSGSMSWEQVRSQRFTSFKSVVALGYGNHPVWIRLRVDPTQGQSQPSDELFLRIRPAYLDELILFDPLQGKTGRRPIGDHYPLANQAVPSPTFVFSLPAGAQSRHIWVRLKTTSTRLVDIEALNEQDLKTSDALHQYWSLLFVCTAIFFIVFATIQFFLKSDKLMFLFIVHQIISLLYGIIVLGHARIYVDLINPSVDLNYLMNFTCVVITTSSLTYSAFIMRDIVPKTLLNKMMTCIYILFAVLCLLLLLNRSIEGLQLNMLATLLSPPILFAIAWWHRGIEDRETTEVPTPVVLGFLAAATMFSVILAAPGIGISPANSFVIYSGVVYAIFLGILMLVTLLFRANFIFEQKVLLTTQVEIERARADKTLTERIERENLLHMLGHELKTPMATLRMLLANHKVPNEMKSKFENPIVEMAEVIERTVQTEQIEGGALVPRPGWLDLNAALISARDGMADASRIRIAMPNGEAGKMFIVSDPYILGIILKNLMDNALKYSPPGSPVSVDVAVREGDQIDMTICNDLGRAGAPDPALAFEKFYRAPKARHCSGSGLGLYMVRALSELIGAVVTCGLNRERVEFRLTMPATPQVLTP